MLRISAFRISVGGTAARTCPRTIVRPCACGLRMGGRSVPCPRPHRRRSRPTLCSMASTTPALCRVLAQSSLLQVSRTQLTTGQGLSQYEAVRFFRDLARKQKSPALAQFANRMYDSMFGDVFGRILCKSMLEMWLGTAAATGVCFIGSWTAPTSKKLHSKPRKAAKSWEGCSKSHFG